MLYRLGRRLLFLATACLAVFLMAGVALADSTSAQTTSTSTSTAAPAGTPVPVCDWGKRIWGQPQSFQAGGTDGYYIWCARNASDKDDAHLSLRTTDSAGRFHYSGVLRTDGEFVGVTKVRDEADDHVDVSPDHKTIRFSFVTYEGVDGFDFHVAGGTKVVFALDRDGTRLDPAYIFLGEDSVHPLHNPFRIERLHHHHGATPTTTTTSSTSTTAASS
jgi:opacity protein-like surface antigen